MLPNKLQEKLNQRIQEDSLRDLGSTSNAIDFSSNDYLGFSKSKELFYKTHQFLEDNSFELNGSTGSRLLSGNYKLYQEVEQFIARVHEEESALVFNSGYTANLGFFATVPQKGDIILYDEYIHASIRDGMKLSLAKSYKFKHNNLVHLEELLGRFRDTITTVYVVTESVFSMDGDSPDLCSFIKLTEKYNSLSIIDEAHALGTFSLGLVQKLKLQERVFARIVTYGKAMGCHGAAILGSKELISYLINFSRSFIYTTGMSPHSIASIYMAYQELLNESGIKSQYDLKSVISFFKMELAKFNLEFIESDSAIQCCVIGGNRKTKQLAVSLQNKGFEVKPILSPTVNKGSERLRFCLHSYNSKEQITGVLNSLAIFVEDKKK